MKVGLPDADFVVMHDEICFKCSLKSVIRKKRNHINLGCNEGNVPGYQNSLARLFALQKVVRSRNRQIVTDKLPPLRRHLSTGEQPVIIEKQGVQRQKG